MTLDAFFQATTAPAPAIRPSRPSQKNVKERAERDTPSAAPTSPPSDPGEVENAFADFMPPAPPLACLACSCWQKVPGLAWWCGRCAVTGRKINMQSRCDLGFEEWQASPLPERTAPQPGARRRWKAIAKAHGDGGAAA